jgi:hypothetical protein
MARRVALASVYTLLVTAFLLTWPLWSPLPELPPDALRIGNPTAIREVPIARWLVILIPFYWGWAALGLEDRLARWTAIAASVFLFVACFAFIGSQDTGGPFCLWDDGHCGSRWFN